MSGPKSASYWIETELARRLREEQRRQAMERACQALERRIAVLKGKCEALAQELVQEGGCEKKLNVVLPQAEELARQGLEGRQNALRRAEKDLEMLTQELQEELSILKWQNRVIRAAQAKMSAASTDCVSFGRQKSDSSGAGETQEGESEDAAADRLSAMKPVFEAISRIEDDEKREGYLRCADQLGAVKSAGAFKEEVLSLKTEVFRCLESQDLHRIAEEELGKLANLAAPLAERAVLAVQSVSDESSLAVALERIDEAVKAELAAAESAYVEQAIRETLANLGYSMGEKMEVYDFGRVDFAKASPLSHHALRVQLDTNGGRLYTRVVSDGTTTEAEDARAEEATCSVVLSALRQLGEKGVKARLVTEQKPGAFPVEAEERLAPARVEKKRRVARQRTVRGRGV